MRQVTLSHLQGSFRSIRKVVYNSFLQCRRTCVMGISQWMRKIFCFKNGHALIYLTIEHPHCYFNAASSVLPTWRSTLAAIFQLVCCVRLWSIFDPRCVTETGRFCLCVHLLSRPRQLKSVAKKSASFQSCCRLEHQIAVLLFLIFTARISWRLNSTVNRTNPMHS